MPKMPSLTNTAAPYLMFIQVTALHFHVAFGASDLQTNRLVSPSEATARRHAVSIISTSLHACTSVCCSRLCCSRCSLGTVSSQSGHTHRKRLQCISCRVKLDSATSLWLRGREKRSRCVMWERQGLSNVAFILWRLVDEQTKD